MGDPILHHALLGELLVVHGVIVHKVGDGRERRWKRFSQNALFSVGAWRRRR